MRTYAGHSSARESNALFRRNLAKGQTGLSVAFDLPTQTGYDADHVLARGEVGRVGVPVGHLGDMRALFDGIPLERTNTSMTINATAMWLLALYQVVAEEQGADMARLTGTTQNDIIKEYLSRGTYVFPPGPSVRLTTDVIAYTVARMPKWNPINVCSYHLQEAGATPVQEIAYALCTATAVLDAVREQVPAEQIGEVVGRISFFVNAGVRFVEEMCKVRAFARLWDTITRERYGIADPARRRFRYGVQVNSLGLTEAQPENNVQRIVLEMLAVTLSKHARARAIQLPAWNEALGLPRPWTSNGACASSRCWPTSRTCWSTATCSTAPLWWRPTRPDWWRAPRRRWPRWPTWAGWCRRWSRGTSRPGWSPRTRPGGRASSPAKTRWWGSTASTPPSRVPHRGRRHRGAQRGPGPRTRGAGGSGGVAPAPRPGGGAGRPRPAQGRRGAPGRQPDGRDPGLRPGRRDHRRVVFRAAPARPKVSGGYDQATKASGFAALAVLTTGA